MKIWRALLILNMEEKENDRLLFFFEKMEEEYKYSKERDEYIYTKGYYYTCIPTKMKVEQCYSVITITIGYDHELTEEEQMKVKKEMIITLRTYLYNQKEHYLKKYNEKMELTNEYLMGGIRN